MLVAPLDANTLGKVASGICDNLLVSDSLCPPPSLGLTLGLLSCRLPLYKVVPCDLFMVGWFAQNTVPLAPNLPHLVLVHGFDLWELSEGVHLSLVT